MEEKSIIGFNIKYNAKQILEALKILQGSNSDLTVGTEFSDLLFPLNVNCMRT